MREFAEIAYGRTLSASTFAALEMVRAAVVETDAGWERWCTLNSIQFGHMTIPDSELTGQVKAGRMYVFVFNVKEDGKTKEALRVVCTVFKIKGSWSDAVVDLMGTLTDAPQRFYCVRNGLLLAATRTSQTREELIAYITSGGTVP